MFSQKNKAMNERLAINGGTPTRDEMLPYGRQSLTDADIQAVVEVLHSNWMTTGPKVVEFEACLSETVCAAETVVVSSGTAALHAAMFALDIGPGDEVIIPAITFAATANAVLFQGGKPVFADVDPDTLLLDPEQVESKISDKTKAVVGVDYAGQSCDYDTLHTITSRRGIPIVADACHALGGTYKNQPVGSLADLNIFSFHPVKHIATGEGGAITTEDPNLAKKIRAFRNHGISVDHHERSRQGKHSYDMDSLGFNYRLSDIQCALGLSQLNRLSQSIKRRQEIAARYDEALLESPSIKPLSVRQEISHAYHIYPVLVNFNRDLVHEAMRAENIGVNVHYMPVYYHSYYRNLGYNKGICPIAESAYECLITLPIFQKMSDRDACDVLSAVTKITNYYST